MTMTMCNDIEFDHHTKRVHLVDGGAFLHKSLNGVLYQMHSAEGYWIFSGPPDNASYNVFGTLFGYHNDFTCFPTSCVHYHDKFPARGTIVSSSHGQDTNDTIFEQKEIIQVCTQFPDENFMHKLEGLSFNRNHEIIRLMPLLQYISKKSI